MSVFSHFEGMRSNALYSSGRAGYAIQPAAMANYKSLAASLSSDSHRLALCTDGYEFDRIPGSQVAAFLDAEPTD